MRVALETLGNLWIFIFDGIDSVSVHPNTEMVVNMLVKWICDLEAFSRST